MTTVPIVLAASLTDVLTIGASIIAVLAEVFFIIALIAVVYTLVTDDRDPSTILAWLLEITLEERREFGAWERFRNHIVRLFSRLL